jgi:hypothetical protein
MNIYSEFLSWSKNDFVKGLLMAVIGAVISFLYQLVSQGGNIFNFTTLQQMGSASLLAALAYLSKNLLSDEDGKFLGKI